MKLFWSPRSPFVRKVLIVAHELGLADRIEKVPATVGSATLSPEVMAISPLNRIPALFDIAGEGDLAVIGSGNICRYLAAMAQPPARPAATDWREAAREAVADGVMEANVLRLGDLVRPEGTRSAAHIAAFAAKTASALDWLETHAGAFSPHHIGAAEAALAAGLAHLDFRFPEDAWRNGRPALARWFAEVAQRDSVIRTAFT